MTEQGYGRERPEYRSAPGQEGPPGQPGMHPGPAAAAGRPAASQEALSAKGFAASLFDFGFNSFVTPRVVKVVYALIMVLIGLSALGFAAFAFRISPVFGIISLCILCPLYFFAYLALWRIALEIFVIIFRIADDLRTIRARGDFR